MMVLKKLTKHEHDLQSCHEDGFCPKQICCFCRHHIQRCVDQERQQCPRFGERKLSISSFTSMWAAATGPIDQ